MSSESVARGSSFSLSLAAQRLERRMPEFHPPLTEMQAIAEANRCLYCYDAPCVKACPTAIDIPEFIRRIGTRNYRASAKTILDANILGLSCARVCPTEVLCAGACVYNHMDRPPIDIGRLQRFSTEWAYGHDVRYWKAGAPNGRRVACVGAGPASLACAHELAKMGYAVKIFEGRELPGGLNTTGVAPYKLYVEDALREVEYILGVGNIEIVTGRWVARETFRELERDFDAIFVGVGLGPDSRLREGGEDLEGVFGAVALIEKLKNRPAGELDWLRAVRSAVVVGGGNTSIDVVRELRKLGVPSVTLLYRRAEADMPGYVHEVKAARQEGVQLAFHAQTVALEGEGGHVRRLRAVRTRSVAEAGGRARLEPIPGSEFALDADLVAVAIGQEMLEELLAGVAGLKLERGRVVVDAKTGQTTSPKYFAGGDCANGGKEVVNAAAEGKVAAKGIHAWLGARSGAAVPAGAVA